MPRNTGFHQLLDDMEAAADAQDGSGDLIIPLSLKGAQELATLATMLAVEYNLRVERHHDHNWWMGELLAGRFSEAWMDAFADCKFLDIQRRMREHGYSLAVRMTPRTADASGARGEPPVSEVGGALVQ